MPMNNVPINNVLICQCANYHAGDSAANWHIGTLAHWHIGTLAHYYIINTINTPQIMSSVLPTA